MLFDFWLFFSDESITQDKPRENLVGIRKHYLQCFKFYVFDLVMKIQNFSNLIRLDQF